eukprot:10927207-Heterocapsa_arctica.AAC.1
MCAVAQLDGHLLDHFLHYTPRHPPVLNLVDDVVLNCSPRIQRRRRILQQSLFSSSSGESLGNQCTLPPAR